MEENQICLGEFKMIEDYIEKDIIRKVKLVEFLFELKELNVSETAERLGVTFNTIKADFQKLVIRLEDDIDYYKMTSSHLLIFSNHLLGAMISSNKFTKILIFKSLFPIYHGRK